LLRKVSDWPPDPHHFLSFTIGLAAWLTVLEGLHLASHRPVYRRVFEFWLKVFIAFGFGVVSGIVMAFQFGMNWSELSRISGPIQGPLFAVCFVPSRFSQSRILGGWPTSVDARRAGWRELLL
jgi:cytochrome bd-type quinol oxidase subunit 1